MTAAQFRQRCGTMIWFLGFISISVSTPITIFADDDNKAAGSENGKTSLSPTVRLDIPFHPADQQNAFGIFGLCDLSIPGGDPPADGFPVVVVTHGGGWISGDKWTMSGFSRRLTDAGIAAMTINYRLAPANLFPAPVDDLRSALIWLAEHSKRLNFDANRIGLWGYSAGAQISLVTALAANQPINDRAYSSSWPSDDPRWMRLPKVAAVVGGGSPCEFTTLPPANRSMAYWLGGSPKEIPNRYIAASPTSHVDKDDPPILLIHGTADLIVPIRSAKIMKAAADQGAASCELLMLPGDGHITTFTSSTARDAAVEFLSRHLQR